MSNSSAWGDSASSPNCSSTVAIRTFEEDGDFLFYQVLGCILYTTCAVVGIVGNSLVIYVVARVRGMKTLTNLYLVSVASADMLVLVSANLPAIPKLFIEYGRWVYGSAMCSFLVYIQYLGINVSALSITAFTLERYIGICHPFTAQVWSTSSRVKRIILGLWVFCCLSNGGWLYLATTVEKEVGVELVEYCGFRIERKLYAIIYTIDLLLFYVLPLLLMVVLYSLIGLTLHRSTHALRRPPASLCRKSNLSTRSAVEKLIIDPAVRIELSSQKTTDDEPREHFKKMEKSRQQVVKMLVVVAALFAILWLPYRALVVYNSFVKEENRYLNKWFLLAAKTMVFANNAMNPILYSIISKKFREAFVQHTCLGRFISTGTSIQRCDSMFTNTITTSSKKEASVKADCEVVINKLPDSSVPPATI